MITPTQIKMARAALGWSVKELSDQTGLHRNTLNAAEKKDAVLRSSTSNLLQKVFEENGLEFIEQNGGGPGVRHKEPIKYLSLKKA